MTSTQEAEGEESARYVWRAWIAHNGFKPVRYDFVSGCSLIEATADAVKMNDRANGSKEYTAEESGYELVGVKRMTELSPV